MSRISQELAAQVAKKMTEKSRLTVDELRKEYVAAVKVAYINQTPKEVMKVYKKFPEWVQARRVVEFSGHGFRWESISVDEPLVCNGSQNCNLTLDDALAHQLTLLKMNWEKAKEAYEKLKSETVEALLALRTYSRIKEHIPAAEPFLPPPISNALVVNFESLNKKLEMQPKSVAQKIKA